MAEFLTTSGTSFYIEKIILESTRKLVLVSPYLKLSKTLYERLKDSSIRGTRITIIYGKDELKPNEYNSLAELKNVSLYYFDNLHAKCYFNESMMVITSMNMYEFSEKTNREMGVLIDCVKDKELFEKAKLETESIIQSADFEQLKKQDRRSNAPAQGNNPASKNPAPGVIAYGVKPGSNWMRQNRTALIATASGLITVTRIILKRCVTSADNLKRLQWLSRDVILVLVILNSELLVYSHQPNI